MYGTFREKDKDNNGRPLVGKFQLCCYSAEKSKERPEQRRGYWLYYKGSQKSERHYFNYNDLIHNIYKEMLDYMKPCDKVEAELLDAQIKNFFWSDE